MLLLLLLGQLATFSAGDVGMTSLLDTLSSDDEHWAQLEVASGEAAPNLEVQPGPAQKKVEDLICPKFREKFWRAWMKERHPNTTPCQRLRSAA